MCQISSETKDKPTSTKSADKKQKVEKRELEKSEPVDHEVLLIVDSLYV